MRNIRLYRSVFATSTDRETFKEEFIGTKVNSSLLIVS
jgi:hypothetical protein